MATVMTDDRELDQFGGRKVKNVNAVYIMEVDPTASDDRAHTGRRERKERIKSALKIF